MREVRYVAKCVNSGCSVQSLLGASSENEQEGGANLAIVPVYEKVDF